MFTEDLQIIEVGNRLLMQHFDPTVSPSEALSGRIMECKVLSVSGIDQFKLSIPSECTEPWMPPLDGLYVFSVVIDEVSYSGKGKIIERFRDEDGDCCIFKIKEALSIDEKKEYLQLNTSLNALAELSDDSDSIEGRVTLLSIDFMVFECGTFIEDESVIQITVILENGKELRSEGSVLETVRLRNGNYQSRIRINKMDIKYQRDLSLWMLQHNKELEN